MTTIVLRYLAAAGIAVVVVVGVLLLTGALTIATFARNFRSQQ